MKIFIPSWGRASSIKTHLLLQGTEYSVVLHSEEEKARYIERSPCLADKIVVSGMPKGISGQRQWIKDNLVSNGEWFCMMDDNIKAFNIFPEPYYGNDTFEYTSQLRKVVEANRPDIHVLLAKFSETIRKAEEIGTGFCGFANIENSFFRKKKWKTIGLVVAKMCLQKKDELRYDTNVHCIDDYAYSIEAMIKYGKILVNSYVFPVANHNEAGGLGKLSERAPAKRKDCEYLIKKYPGLLRLKTRKNSLEGCEVCLRFYKEEQFNKWREEWAWSDL